MMRRKFFLLGAILAGIAMAGLAPPARATFEISVFVNGVNQNVTTSGTANSFFFIGTVSSVINLQITSLTNWSGSPSGGLMTDTSNALATFTGNFSGTLTVVISENSWVAPATSPLLLTSSAGGSIGDAGGTLSVGATNQGFFDNTNTLATTTTPGGSSTPLANASASLGGSGTAPLVYNPSPGSSIIPGGEPFAMTQVFTFTGSGTGAVSGDSENVSGSVSVAPVPAPAGLVLALTGLPCLGIGRWLRRRLKTA